MRRKRVRINPYGVSKSAKEVSKYLNILRLQKNGKFKGRATDIVVNWGNGRGNVGDAMQVNHLDNVAKASNKLICLETLSANGVMCPTYYTRLDGLPGDTKLVARTNLFGHSGDGIVIGTKEELLNDGVSAPLYTEYVDKVAEYRVIVCNNTVVDIKSKRKRDGATHDPYVWNHSNGYNYTRNIGTYHCKLPIVGVEAVRALGLDFGAVDIIQDEEGALYVLEVNTAFGVEGSTTELFCKELKEVIDGK